MEPVHLRLFVTGQNLRSEEAIHNLKQICSELGVDYDLEIIDVLQDPEKADQDHILATPTLLKTQPEPSRRVIGDLTNHDLVKKTLGISNSHPSY